MRGNKILVLLIAVSYARISLGYDCDCTCRQLQSRLGGNGVVCSFLENLSNAVVANEAALMNWNKHYNFVSQFSANWRKEITEVVRVEIQNGIGDEHRSPQKMNRHLGQEDNIKTTSSPKKEDALSVLEKKFREMENKTVHLEKGLAQQKKANEKLKEDNMKSTSSLEKRFREMEARTLQLEKDLAQQQKVNVKLEEDNIKTTSSLEERFREMEARTLQLEKDLDQQQKANGKLERNVEGTQSALINVTKQILNLISTADTIVNMLLSDYPSMIDKLNDKITYFVQNVIAEIKNLYEIQNANAL